MAGPDAVALIVEVPALNVKPVLFVKLIGDEPLKDNVEPLRLIVRVLELLDDRSVAVML